MDIYPALSSRSSLPPALIPSLTLLIVVTLALPPNRFISFASLFAFIATLAQLPFYTSGATDYVKGCEAGIAFLRFVVLVFCFNPRRQSRRVHKTAAEGREPDGKNSEWETKSTTARFWWSFQLVTSLREIGFSTQVKNVPPAPSEKESVWKFSFWQLVWAVLYFLLYDICETYCQIEGQRGLVSILSEPLSRQFQLTCIAAFKQYFQLEFQYAAVASLTTMLRLYKPRDWPPMFGEWADAWSVRRFWGRTWHQMMRNMITIPSTLVADGLGFRSGSWPSTYSKLFLSFFFSACFHSAGGIFAARQELGEFKCFLLQAVAITIEDIVLKLGRSMGWTGGVWGRILGYIWLVTWLSWSLRGWVDGRVRGGEWSGRQIPFSVMERLWKGT